MRFVLVSDTHNRHEFITLPEGDVLIHAGDFTDHGSEKETANFLDWFSRQPHPRKILVHGNHDSGKCTKNLCPPNVTHLDGTYTMVGPYKVWGFSWPEQSALKAVDRVDILITHYPPFGVLDAVERQFGFGVAEDHTGVKFLAEFVAKRKPYLHVFGHIHEHAGGHVTHQKIDFINACVLDESLRPVAQPQVWEY